ncbi:ammonium transporter [Novosphingobium ginsenosidimutans]|uniref:Ammonium transporter n=1 Tax=Novosphingobium ginsenosidimutans TaxID=1176536 RepID=A0A5B8S127_9SPHN|nr:ammonium transporter [Novosphingobium ginsenosidimutans]QEA15229.1 ammonium transporter [Novosphingobium ginsenosidimutans]
MIRKIVCGLGAAGASLFAATAAFAQDATAAATAAATEAAATATEAATTAAFTPTAEMVNKGDVAWMLVASALVLLMSVPALALFYGGLVRAKNMLSVLMQVLTIVCVAALVWFAWGYSMAFTSTGTPFPKIVGGLDKAFLAGVDVTTFAATFSNSVYLPEYVFVIFQMTFACITPALIVGAFAERVKFTPLIIFTVLWLTFAYFPIAHMVWYWAGPDFLHAAPDDSGLLWGWGALDFAGGTVVHINAGIAGLIGCLVIGPRVGFKTESMPPHSLVMTMIGASLLWIGWFGFNAGSGLEANAFGALAFINTFVATAAAGVTWAVIEQIVHKKPSLLGAASGVVTGLVAITPAAGFAHPGTAIILGAVATVVCFFFVTTVKNKLKYDDSLDVFGIHAVGGIVGAIGTGFVANPAWGGQGWIDYTAPVAKAGEFDLYGQVMTQIWAVGTTVLWTGVVSTVLFLGLKYTIGLRPSVEAEREGLDITEHGERAYNM